MTGIDHSSMSVEELDKLRALLLDEQARLTDEMRAIKERIRYAQAMHASEGIRTDPQQYHAMQETLRIKTNALQKSINDARKITTIRKSKTNSQSSPSDPRPFAAWFLRVAREELDKATLDRIVGIIKTISPGDYSNAPAIDIEQTLKPVKAQAAKRESQLKANNTQLRDQVAQLTGERNALRRLLRDIWSARSQEPELSKRARGMAYRVQIDETLYSRIMELLMDAAP